MEDANDAVPPAQQRHQHASADVIQQVLHQQRLSHHVNTSKQAHVIRIWGLLRTEVPFQAKHHGGGHITKVSLYHQGSLNREATVLVTGRNVSRCCTGPTSHQRHRRPQPGASGSQCHWWPEGKWCLVDEDLGQLLLELGQATRQWTSKTTWRSWLLDPPAPVSWWLSCRTFD